MILQEKLPVFSPDGYIDILQKARENGFEFIRFAEKDLLRIGSKYCLIRHDVDNSLKCALEMARLENSQGVVSTYFFMTRSPAYNIFGRYAHKVLDEIKKMGHEIALHFDAAHPAINDENLIGKTEWEIKVLSEIAGQSITSVSFHQPSAEILQKDIFIPNAVNTYNKQQMKGWYYSSDSNRIWKEHNAYSVFKSDHEKVQLLIHPLWWIYDHESIVDSWNAAIVDNFYIMQQQFLETERAYGKPREISIAEISN